MTKEEAKAALRESWAAAGLPVSETLPPISLELSKFMVEGYQDSALRDAGTVRNKVSQAVGNLILLYNRHESLTREEVDAGVANVVRVAKEAEDWLKAALVKNDGHVWVRGHERKVECLFCQIKRGETPKPEQQAPCPGSRAPG
jgi:hypothetical protein